MCYRDTTKGCLTLYSRLAESADKEAIIKHRIEE